MQGKAADLNPKNVSVKKLYDTIIDMIKKGELRDGGVGIYNTFVHYDIGNKGRRWDYRK